MATQVLPGEEVYVYTEVLKNLSRNTGVELDENFGTLAGIGDNGYQINLYDGNTVFLSGSEFEAA